MAVHTYDPSAGSMRSREFREKVAKVMSEFKRGTLHHGGSGEVVHRSDMAKAIAMSEAKKMMKQKRKRKKGHAVS